MRRIAGTIVLMAAAASAAMGQAPQPRRQAPASAAAGPMDAPVPNPAAMDRLLELWARQNGTLKSLTVGFRRFDESKAWGDKTEYVGNAYLQSPNLACLHFKKVERPKGQPAKSSDHERIVCTGQEVRQYDYVTRQIFVFPLDRDQRKRALQEGPLPFLFNLDAKQAKVRWGMTLMGEDKDNYLIGIVPRFEADQAVFSKAFLQLSKKTFLPDRLMLVDTNGKDTQDYQFTGVSPNTPVEPVFFQALNIKGWKVVLNPEPAQAAAARRGEAPPSRAEARPPVGARPAGPAGRRAQQ